ncbi:MAG: hypothetical protein KGK17_07990 [Betaproteobacteria bacterium]|nr:hypothetical protein [Betaproteobacteria bacterium]
MIETIALLIFPGVALFVATTGKRSEDEMRQSANPEGIKAWPRTFPAGFTADFGLDQYMKS